MTVEERLFQHPFQASRVRLAVYEQPADTSPVEGLPDDAGFLVTEEWRGSSSVVKTLGFFADRKAAVECLARRAGIDAANYLVDLHLKLAVPFASFVLACVAVPLAGRVQRHPSVAAILLSGLVVGFAYWVILALTNSLGESGVLPAVVSAWAANVVFLLLGGALFLSTE